LTILHFKLAAKTALRKGRLSNPGIFGAGLGLLLATGDAVDASAGALFDPFLERFQVGAYSDPSEIVMASGYPMGLLEPVQVDRDWIRAARQVLRTDGPLEESASLTHRMLVHLMDGRAAINWLGDRELAVAELLDESSAENFSSLLLSDFLGREILARRFFLSIRNGQLPQAAELAAQLALGDDSMGGSERATFVWELRARILGHMIGAPGDGFATPLWRSMLDLGPFDAKNAWALWVAHRRDLELPVLLPEVATEDGERFLAGLGKGWIPAASLYKSDFGPSAQAAIGANLFSGQELATHMTRFPVPPTDFRRQGSWVKGARFARRGQSDAYEELARRKDLSPGWRLDVWRRASELRYLAGQNSAGLANLEEALAIADRKEGTLPLRRRLRQWCEQSMVLCLARNDTIMARRIFDLAKDSFHDEEAAAFSAETAYWLPIVDPDESTSSKARAGDLTGRSRTVIEAGQARNIGRVDDMSRLEFSEACDRPLWELWARWGAALAEAGGLTAQRALDAKIYADTLAAGLVRFERSGEIIEWESTALACIELRHGRGAVGQRLLESALDRDIVLARGSRGAPLPTIIPSLAKECRGSQLDRHALLGYCLAAGDMRGMLAVAYGLPAKGLEPEEKLRFLYPLPAPGSVRNAILAADAEPALVLAVARNESLFEPNVRSRAGALGFMQIMPFHYESRGALLGTANWACPEISIAQGARILGENRGRYRGDPYLAVAAYNAGPGAAARWEKQLGGDPASDVYLAWIGYPETRRYVEKVLIDREIYDWIITSDSDR
jgi:Transglycosylase SLT domain